MSWRNNWGWTDTLAAVIVVVVVLIVVAAVFKYVVPLMFEVVYGDAVREIIREIVKPEALK